jgi:hypothetical protein
VSIRKNLFNLRKPDGWLKLVLTSKFPTLLSIFVIAYVFAAGVFGGLYLAAGNGVASGTTSASVGETLFFSLVTQSTLGYGNQLPQDFCAQSVAVIQILFGLTYLALVPSVILVRVFSPGYRAIKIADKATFDPTFGQFRFRFVSISVLEASGEPELVLERRAAGISKRTTYNLRLHSKSLPPIEHDRLRVVESFSCAKEATNTDEDRNTQVFKPDTLEGEEYVELILTVQYPLGSPARVFRRFQRCDIVCGEFAEIEKRPRPVRFRQKREGFNRPATIAVSRAVAL